MDSDTSVTIPADVFTDEELAREFIERRAWPNGPICPRCDCTQISKLTARPDSRSPVRPGVYKCRACRKQFTVSVGRVFQGTHLPFTHWLGTLHLLTNSKC